MPQHSPSPIRTFFRVWAIYGSVVAGAVGAALVITSAALFSGFELLRSAVPQLNRVFRGDGVFSGFDKTLSNGFEYFGMSLVMPLITWLFLVILAIIPATIVGLVYELLNKYLRSEKIVLTVTYGLAAVFSTVYGVARMGWQHDGYPFLNIPLALMTGLIACNITLRFRRNDVRALLQ